MARLPLGMLASLTLSFMLACSGASVRFSAATLALSEGEELRDAGAMPQAAERFAAGVALTRELIDRHPDDPLVKRVRAGTIRVGPYAWQYIDKGLAERVAIWNDAATSLLARAFLEAETVSRDEGRVELLLDIAEAVAESGRPERSTAILQAAEADVPRRVDSLQTAWDLIALAQANMAFGNPDRTLEQVDEVMLWLEEPIGQGDAQMVEILAELTERSAEITDDSVAVPILERVGEVASLLGGPMGGDFILEEIAFALARRGRCFDAQEMIDYMAWYPTDDACDCEAFEEDAYSDAQARLELLFDIFDECVDTDREAAALLLEDALAESQEIGWHEFTADVAWGFAVLGEPEQALDVARSIPLTGPRFDALLAIAEELSDREEPPTATACLQEAADLDMTGEPAADRFTRRVALADRLSLVGETALAAVNADKAMTQLQALEPASRTGAIVDVISLSRLLTDEHWRTIDTLVDAELKAHKSLPPQLQFLASLVVACQDAGEKARARKLLDRAVALAQPAGELEDPAFWCGAALAYAALDEPALAEKMVDRLTGDDQYYCLLSLTEKMDARRLSAPFQERLQKAMRARDETPTRESGSAAPADPETALPDCAAEVAQALALSSAEARARALLHASDRCEGPEGISDEVRKLLSRRGDDVRGSQGPEGEVEEEVSAAPAASTPDAPRPGSPAPGTPDPSS
jgi:tetratricopeptide (TPR) repeat protein